MGVTDQYLPYEKRAREFVGRILKSKSSNEEKEEEPIIIKILEIIANNLDTDIKSRLVKTVETQANSQKQIDIMFYIEKAISSYALIKQTNREKANYREANVLESLNEELNSIIGNKSSLFRDDIDLSS